MIFADVFLVAVSVLVTLHQHGVASHGSVAVASPSLYQSAGLMHMKPLRSLKRVRFTANDRPQQRSGGFQSVLGKRDHSHLDGEVNGGDQPLHHSEEKPASVGQHLLDSEDAKVDVKNQPPRQNEQMPGERKRKRGEYKRSYSECLVKESEANEQAGAGQSLPAQPDQNGNILSEFKRPAKIFARSYSECIVKVKGEKNVQEPGSALPGANGAQPTTNGLDNAPLGAGGD